jgi:hypothetical protein
MGAARISDRRPESGRLAVSPSKEPGWHAIASWRLLSFQIVITASQATLDPFTAF